MSNIIKNAKIKLFRRDSQLQFFGICAYKFDWVIKQLDENTEGCVRFSQDSSTPADGIIYINELFVSKPDYNHDNLIALIIHELLHILKKHGTRRRNRNNEIYNFAADHVIDRELKQFKNIFPYQNQFNIIKELDDLYPNCTTEEAYNWLLKNDSKFDYEHNEVLNNETDEKFIVENIPGELGADKDKNKETEQQINQFVAQARSIQETLKQKGNMSAQLTDYLNQLLKIELPWDYILEKSIKTNSIIKPGEQSWQKLNNYYIPIGMTMPGHSLIEENENVGTLVIMVDSSGSISKNNLKQFAYTINKFLSYFKKVILLVHDTVIHNIEIFDCEDYLKFKQFIKTIGFQGRGGTSHQYVFDYVQTKLWDDRDERDNLSMVISLTDGYSDFEIYQDYKWLNTTPFLIITPQPYTFDFNGYENIQIIQMK